MDAVWGEPVGIRAGTKPVMIRRTHLAIPLLLLPVSLVACGDDDDDDAAGGPFCAAVAEIETLFASVDETSSPSEVEAAMAAIGSALSDAAAEAPDEIAGDIEPLVALQLGQLDAVEAAGYDINAYWSSIDETQFDDLSDEEARFGSYVADTCGIDIEE